MLVKLPWVAVRLLQNIHNTRKLGCPTHLWVTRRPVSGHTLQNILSLSSAVYFRRAFKSPSHPNSKGNFTFFGGAFCTKPPLIYDLEKLSLFYWSFSGTFFLHLDREHQNLLNPIRKSHTDYPHMSWNQRENKPLSVLVKKNKLKVS